MIIQMLICKEECVSGIETIKILLTIYKIIFEIFLKDFITSKHLGSLMFKSFLKGVRLQIQTAL